MRRFEFTDEQFESIKRERFQHPDPHVQRRLEILWLKAHGEKNERIAELAGVGRATVQRVLSMFYEGGLKKVRTLNWHHPTSELEEHRPTIEVDFREQPPHTIREACERIEQLTGVRRKETQVRRFLRETLGYRWLKVSAVPVPPKKSAEEHAAIQADFLKGRVGATA